MAHRVRYLVHLFLGVEKVQRYPDAGWESHLAADDLKILYDLWKTLTEKIVNFINQL